MLGNNTKNAIFNSFTQLSGWCLISAGCCGTGNHCCHNRPLLSAHNQM